MKRFLVSIFYLDEIICPSISIRNRELIFLGRDRTNAFEDNTARYSYLFKILVIGDTGFLYKRLSGPYGEFQPLPICKFALFTWLFSVWGWLVFTL